ncbi:tetratricopeptide repeat protein [Rubritalea spongiae]|uniref:Tetratricopeptide repeat protein n=1 Tax=Rubritalea spongiae TaxID=430797 RepID=A0ABW5E4I2_9BACT
MGTPTPQSAATRRPTFAFACGLLACIAFAQLLSVGIAIALRSGETREVIRYVKGDPLIVSVPTLRDPIEPKGKAAEPRSIEQILATYASDVEVSSEALETTTATTNSTPVTYSPTPSDSEFFIEDPQAELLIEQAIQEHSKGDIMNALVKLEEAESLASDEPAIFYRKALLFEDMGQWDRATDNYEKIFTMGPSIGVLYHKAAFKLSHGINPEANKQNLLVIGHILHRISDDKLHARLTIPIRSGSNSDFDPTHISVEVHHYDLVDNKRIEPVPPARADAKSERWLNPPMDWADGEEIAEATYTLPSATEADVHLFGERKYFGYVAELYYKNELLDQQAYPRRLHAIHAEKQNQPNYDMPFDFPLDEPLPNINPDNPLLPALPRN